MTITVLRMAAQVASTTRIGTAERERAAADLAEHLSAGRLTTEEFDERVQQAYAARTAAELAPLFRDLPELHPAAPKRRIDRRPLLILGLVAATIAWVAFLHVPPFFLFPLVWFLLAGRRFGRSRGPRFSGGSRFVGPRY